MSALPSPLKSPVPAACHGAANAVTARPVVELADFQMVLYPFAELRHRISARPSPSKSPVPATVHTEPYNRVTGWVVLEPADRQTTMEPLLRLPQRRAVFPSQFTPSLAHCAQ